jgi:hypothetical protein
MNRYSRVFHHISLDDVKRNRAKAEEKQKNFLESIKEARNFLRDLNSPHYSDWRNNLVKEGMNTSNVFQTTFPSTGESNLENIDANDADVYTAAGGLDALNGASIKASGSGTGSDGGFDLGQSYLAFDGTADSRHAILDPIDSSKFDTMVINAIVGNDSNGGEDPDAVGEELRLYYLEPGGSSFKSISINSDGDLTNNSDILIDLGAGNGSLQQFSISLPSYARGEGFTYMLYQLLNSGTEFDHYGITNIKYQRRSPITLFVSLDSPEAVSFINDGSGGLSPEEKKKRLEDMLAASDEYMDTMFPTNQEAMRRAEENLKRNIEISLDPDTFKFPEYGTPEYNQMFNPYMDADSDVEQIKNSLESKGLSLDNLDKDFNSQRGLFQSLGQEGTLILLNNPDTQEQALTAMGIDPSLVTNYTPDSWEKISKITNLRPGGTPATGWDGKFYRFDDPQLEASQVIPLETYLQVKGTDNYLGVERPDRAEPGKRYVMEKEYTFSDPEPTYTGVRNKDIEERNDRTHYIASVGTDMYVGGHKWDYTLYTKDADLKGSKHMLQELVGSATRSLNYINQNAEFLAYDFLRKYQSGEAGSFYGDLYNQYKDTDIFNNYDPLWVWKSDSTMSSMLTLLKGISSGSSLMYPRSDYTSDSSYQSALSRNDRLVADLQKALGLFDSPRTLSQYEKDEWYYERDDDRVTEVRTTHPYSGLSEPGLTPEEPTPEEPQEPTERDPYNYYPEFDEIEDIPSRITGEDVNMTIDDLGAAGYAAYKAGGGDAKVKQGYTVAQVIKIGQANINAFEPGAPVQKPISNPESQAPNLVNNMKVILTDFLPPAAKYKTNIAVSILQNKPVQNVASSRDKQLFLQGLNPNGFGTDDYSTYKVTRSPIPYADDNIRERSDGSVEVNPNPSTNNTTVVGQATRATLGFDNPLAAAGQAQVQLVVPSNNPNDAYIRYVDHAYLNLNSTDKGEIPKGDFLSGPIAGLIGGSQRQHTGGFRGYPPNIKGDQVTRFDVPYGQLPDNLKQVVTREIDYMSIGGGSLGDTLQGTGAADAASVAADTKSKKKKKVTEMYEPKAKHNEKITKHPKIKSPKEFFKRADIKPVYPDTPPPEMINGRHPDLVDGKKVSQRFNRLDPISARSMPPTGNPHIDMKARAAAKKPK